MCENCGIKVAGVEGAPCPGCGHSPSNSTQPTSRFDAGSDKSSSISSESIESVLNKNLFDTEWTAGHFRECEGLFDPDRPQIDQTDILEKIIEKTKEKIKTSPNKESEYRLYSYISIIFRLSDNYKESYEAGLIGNESSSKFFVEQSQYSILDSLFNLGKYEELEAWIERASQSNHPEANWFRIRYLTTIKKFDEALNACEEYYSSNPEVANSNRADILVKANRLDEAELVFRKLVASGPRHEYHANWVNSLAFSVLMPQKRFHEAERILVSAICTKSEREKINAFSNLAMVALSLKEFKAAKRYAKKATVHPENAIASESRLTLCNIEQQRLFETQSTSQAEWRDLFDLIKDGLEKTDFDDAANFLELLITSSEMAHKSTEILVIIDEVFAKLKTTREWLQNNKVRNQLETLRIDVLSKHYLKENMYLELDELFISAVSEITGHKFLALLEYLRTPFPGIDLRRVVLKTTNKEFLAEWAQFEEQSEILYGLAKNQDEPILVALAENPASTDVICELISKKNDIDLDFALCGRANLSKHMSTILAKSTFDAVRKLIAMRDDLSQETYTALATDDAMLVRDAIRENQACSAEIRALAALGSL
jgi:hypothetical protein